MKLIKRNSMKEYYLKNKDKMKRQIKEYIDTNKDKIKLMKKIERKAKKKILIKINSMKDMKNIILKIKTQFKNKFKNIKIHKDKIKVYDDNRKESKKEYIKQKYSKNKK